MRFSDYLSLTSLAAPKGTLMTRDVCSSEHPDPVVSPLRTEARMRVGHHDECDKCDTRLIVEQPGDHCPVASDPVQATGIAPVSSSRMVAQLRGLAVPQRHSDRAGRIANPVEGPSGNPVELLQP